jgi:preprotein translocase subunit Sss1
MKTLDELRRFYHQNLKPDLQVLEKQRLALVKKITAIGIIAFGVAGIVILLFAGVVRDAVPVIIFPLMAAGGITFGLGWFISVGYRSEFKMSIIERLVSFVDSQLNYNQGGCVKQSEFNASKIFHTKPNRYKGDDLVWGKVGQTAVKFSEVDAKYESGSGKNRTVQQIFKGLFFIADFNKHFHGRTVVLPDATEKVFGKLAQTFQKLNFTRDDLVKLEDPEFEKEFVVYSNDQVEARYILSTSLMKRIVDFKRNSSKKIHLSFINSQVNVAVSFKRSLFEPKLFSTLLDFEPIQEYFEDLSLAVGIVEDLNLNTRIWTKE